MAQNKLKLTVTIEGDTTSDLEIALEEVLRLVSEEYTSGFNSNESGNFQMEIKEEDNA